MLSEEADVQNSLELLFSTGVGERIMQPKFGCNLEFLQFEPMSVGLKTELQHEIFNAIYYHEPRVEPLNVSVLMEEEEGILNIIVEYRIRITNTRHNIVYPFYLNEGTNL